MASNFSNNNMDIKCINICPQIKIQHILAPLFDKNLKNIFE